MNETLGWVAWLRIACIYAVVLLHACGAQTNPRVRGTADWTAGATVMLIGSCAVPVFVMISGALVLRPAARIDSGALLRKRVRRLVPAILFWNAVYLAYRVAAGEASYTPRSLAGAFLRGELASHLYFFWIVLGLGVTVPVLQRWIRDTGRREWLIGGAVALIVPLASSTLQVTRGGAEDWPDVAWAIWVPYLGYFILGYALRGVLLPRWAVAVAVPTAAACVAYSVWAYQNPAVPRLLAEFFPLGYYGPVNMAYAILVFLIGQAVLRPGRALGALVRPRVLRYAEPVGAATLGIFGLHLLVLTLLVRGGVFAAPGAPFRAALAQGVATCVLSTAIVLPLRRVPVVRAVL